MEIFAAKANALISRAAARDLYDYCNMIEMNLFSDEKDMFRKCILFYATISAKEVNKGLTVKVMLEKYNISPQNAMAFGDQWNDLEMLKFVKYGYLMGNATEELKKEFSSDRITLSNDEDGIYEVLKNL